MPLTVRENGTTSPSLITASWWNDYLSLLTGAMNDQPILLNTTVQSQAIADNPTSAPSAATASGTALGVGVYKYIVTYYGTVGETAQSPSVSITTTTNNQDVNLSSIPLGPTGTTGRKIYRTLVGGSAYHLVTTIANNTATTYADTATDASISAAASPPSDNLFGGYFQALTHAGSVGAALYSDGNIQGNQLISTGSTLQLGSLLGRPGQANDVVGFGLNGSSDSGFMLGSSGGALVFGTYGSCWWKINTYFDNTNDRYWTAATAYQLNFTGAAFQIRQSTGTPAAGGIVTWGSWRPFTVVFTGTSTPVGAQEGDVWIKA
jgi:hypothetical protein